MGTVTRIGVVLQDALDQEVDYLPEWQLEIVVSQAGSYPDPLEILIMISERIDDEDPTNR
jgi:hypothetical protein